ncbi:MAG: hypothetical protein ACON5A_03735 [Candidatus Comchoanobacterales bacterium]
MKNKLSLTVALAVGFSSAPAIYAMGHESTDEGHYTHQPTVQNIEEFNVGHECDCVEPDMLMEQQGLDPSVMMMNHGGLDQEVIRSLEASIDPRQILNIPADHHTAETSSDPAMWRGGVIINITFDGYRLLLEKLSEMDQLSLHASHHRGAEILIDPEMWGWPMIDNIFDGYRLLLEKIPEDSSDVGPEVFILDEHGLPIEQRKDIKH